MSKEQIKQWIKEKNMKSVDAVKSALKELFAEMPEGEIESTLGYPKHVTKNKWRWIGGMKKWGGEPFFCANVLPTTNETLSVESREWVMAATK